MSRTDRVFEVLGLFSEQTPRLRAADIGERLGVAPATAYRCIENLLAAGLLEAAGAGDYVLGPTIVELDRRIRLSDPLIDAAAPVMQRLAERTGGVVLLCRLHGLKVLCVHQVAGPLGPARVSYERGRAMPLYRGATSKIILAHLPAEVVAGIARDDARALAEAGLPSDLPALTAHLQALRGEKVCASVAEVDKGAMGWGAALHHGRKLLGSLSVVMARRQGGTMPAAALIVDQLRRSALRIEGRLEAADEASRHKNESRSAA
jgi:DNA-binding IclR family transcriptional regulator